MNPPPGWLQTFPNGGTTPPADETVVNTCPAPAIWGYEFTVPDTGSHDFTGDDFGNWVPPTKSGMKFNDVDNSGTKNAGDLPLSGWPINLSKQDANNVFARGHGQHRPGTGNYTLRYAPAGHLQGV